MAEDVIAAAFVSTVSPMSICYGNASIDEARTHAEALDVALRDGVAAKSDIDRLEAKIEMSAAKLKVGILAGWWCRSLRLVGRCSRRCGLPGERTILAEGCHIGGHNKPMDMTFI
ncbi:hypothetical protein [Methylosinus sp. RM1]|uniref:hypothetical protein n=1 Tax=Methylosinus sp. RM1 TaxID=2583817 RepID=UPI0014079158|nr:hypothetical protein [Methylosinus sp. RM1]